MAVKITYFVHGTSFDNEAGISSGWKDVELSPLGVQQSKDLKEKIKDKKFDVVFCSDLKRAIHSAELTWGGEVEIIKDARLRECDYGDLNGKPLSVVEPLQEKKITEPFPGGESYEDVKARIQDFLEDLKKNYEGKHVALLAHKAPQLVLDVILKGRTWEQAFAEDWRKTPARGWPAFGGKSWQPGWNYTLP